MTQDATTPLAALQATLADKLGHDTLAARQSLIADGLNPDAKITFDEHGNAPIKPEDFYTKLDHLEAEGAALLKTAETHIEDAGHTILDIGEHTLSPIHAAPWQVDQARALPLAMPGDRLHKSEHAVVRAFMDLEDVLRHVYLNIHGLWVKA